MDVKKVSFVNSTLKIFFKCSFTFERWRERVSGGGAEREGDVIQSRLQALSWQHRARLEARTHELWDHKLSWSQCLTSWATQAPLSFLNFILFYFWESKSGGGAEKGEQRIWSWLCADSCKPVVGLELIKLQDHDPSQSQTLNWLCLLGTPELSF